jgi:hypothetical protein
VNTGRVWKKAAVSDYASLSGKMFSQLRFRYERILLHSLCVLMLGYDLGVKCCECLTA